MVVSRSVEAQARLDAHRQLMKGRGGEGTRLGTRLGTVCGARVRVPRGLQTGIQHLFVRDSSPATPKQTLKPWCTDRTLDDPLRAKASPRRHTEPRHASWHPAARGNIIRTKGNTAEPDRFEYEPSPTQWHLFAHIATHRRCHDTYRRKSPPSTP